MSPPADNLYEGLLAPCGLNCAECGAHIATQVNDARALARVAAEWSRAFGVEITLGDVICDGCRTDSVRKYAHVKTCGVRPCALRRRVRTCAHCDDYICETLLKHFDNVPRTRDLLKAVRDGIQK